MRSISNEHLEFPLLVDTSQKETESRRKLTSLNEFIPEHSPGLPKIRDRRGIYFMLISSAGGVASNTLRKLIPHVPSPQLLFLRAPLILITITVYFLIMKKTDELRSSFSPRTALVGIFMTLTASIFFTATLYLPLSEIQPISSTTAIFLAILAAIFLGEPYLPIERLLGLVSFLGVILIIRPPFLGFGSEEIKEGTNGLHRYVAGMFAVVGAASNAAAQVTIRSTKAKWHAFVMPFQINLTVFVVYGVFFVTFGDLRVLQAYEYFLICISAIINMTGLYCMARALAIEKPAVVGLAQYSELIYALLVDLIIFRTLPSLLTIVGASLIVASCLYIVLSKR